jgi:hypothetical protein
MTLKLQDTELAADGASCWVVKDEVVSVEFAVAPGVLESAVGLNRYAAGDALLTGSTGDRWSVSRDRFDAKYRPEPPVAHGQTGKYRNRPVPLLAKRMSVAFTVARSAGGDELQGNAGDWLLQYAPGDHGVVAQARFEAVYAVQPTDRLG